MPPPSAHGASPPPAADAAATFAGGRRRHAVAVITACYHRSPTSFCFLTPFLFSKLTQPAVEVVSLYADQQHRSMTLT